MYLYIHIESIILNWINVFSKNLFFLSLSCKSNVTTFFSTAGSGWNVLSWYWWIYLDFIKVNCLTAVPKLWTMVLHSNYFLGAPWPKKVKNKCSSFVYVLWSIHSKASGLNLIWIRAPLEKKFENRWFGITVDN